MEEDDILKNGSRFGKYTIERLLGRGGMGAVYLVRHQMLGSLFALKVLDAAMAKRSGDFVTRFIREAKLASNIRHPNLAAVHDAGFDEEQGLYYLVMDYLPGGNLRDRISERGRLPPDEAVRIVRQIAAALVTADLHGMVHRDIKPENIMFAADGSAKLTDLGIAKGNGEQDTLVTMDSSVFGTPAYMAPEQAKDASSVDCRADIWSLGVMLYEMLSGRRPYEGDGLGSIVAQLLSPDPFPDIHAVAPDVPDALAGLVGEMCVKDRDKRLATPRELVARLGALDLRPERKPSDSPGDTQVTLVTQVTMATMAGTATGTSGGDAKTRGAESTMLATEPVYVEPEPDPSVTAFEAEAEARIRAREARQRRLRVVMWLLAGALCILVGLVTLKFSYEKTRSEDAPVAPPVTTPVQKPPVEPPVTKPGPRPPVEPPVTKPEPRPPVERPVTTPVQKPAVESPVTAPVQKPAVESPVTAPVQKPAVESPVTAPVQKPPVKPTPLPPPPPRVVVVGIDKDEASLRAMVSGDVQFQRIMGRTEAVQAQIENVVAMHPDRIVLALSRYAASKEMSSARFELFVREIGKNLAVSGVPFAFVVGGGDYGRAIRAAAQENSWDLME